MAETMGRKWVVFVYASVKERVRTEQWQELYIKSRKYGDKWMLGCDFNDISYPQEKRGGNARSEASCKGSRES